MEPALLALGDGSSMVGAGDGFLWIFLLMLGIAAGAVVLVFRMLFSRPTKRPSLLDDDPPR